jgi:Tol biopolymer transport system component
MGADYLDYSRDGKWIAYASYPDGALWKCRPDGTERQRLSESAMRMLNPRWSPDGKEIAFAAAAPGKIPHVYTIPAEGGEARQRTNGEGGPGGEADAEWSPDGGSIAFGCQSVGGTAGCTLKILNAKTGAVREVAGSEDTFSPRWSPDGRYLAALGRTTFRLWLYDLEAGTKERLTDLAVGWPKWARDSRAIYFEDNATTGWYRMTLKDKKRKLVAPVKGLNFAEATYGWVGMTPEGALIATRDAGNTRLYALEWDWRAR